MAYLKNPDKIYRESFAAIRRECDLSTIPPEMEKIIIRMVHACGMPDVIDDLAWHGDVSAAAAASLLAGHRIYVDAKMVAAGLMKKYLPASAKIQCFLDNPKTSLMAVTGQTTRSAAAVDLWDRIPGSIVVIGNAPTALFRLLERMEQEHLRPAAIIAVPVGFIGAAESKQALVNYGTDIPYVTLLGRRGGTSIAAAAMNAIILSLPTNEESPQ